MGTCRARCVGYRRERRKSRRQRQLRSLVRDGFRRGNNKTCVVSRRRGPGGSGKNDSEETSEKVVGQCTSVRDSKSTEVEEE